jgi:hypothetical protein
MAKAGVCTWRGMLGSLYEAMQSRLIRHALEGFAVCKAPDAGVAGSRGQRQQQLQLQLQLLVLQVIDGKVQSLHLGVLTGQTSWSNSRCAGHVT